METGVVAREEGGRGAVVAPVAHRWVFPADALAKEAVERETVAVGLEMAVTDWVAAEMEVEAEA